MDHNEIERVRSMMGERSGMQDWVMPAVLLAVGMPLVLLALWMAGSELLFRAGALPAKGTVIERKGDVPSLVVEYREGNGTVHRLETFGSDLYQDVEVGHEVKVYMNPAKPAEARLDFFTDAFMLPLIFGVFGSFFAIPGLFFLHGMLRPRLLARSLETKGLRVQAEVVDIEPELTMAGFKKRRNKEGNVKCMLRREGEHWRMNVNGKECDPFDADVSREWGIQYRVVAQWRNLQTGQTHECTSDAVDALPVAVQQFRKVTVLVDPDNPENCRVDWRLAMPDVAALAAGLQTDR